MTDLARIAVRDIGHRSRTWLLAIDGRGAVEASEPRILHGFGCPYPGPFSAVFVHGGRLWLQIGADRWDVADIARVDQLRDGARRTDYAITFHDRSVERVRIRFPARVLLERVLDMTYDEMASWDHDIMKMLPYTDSEGWTAGNDVATWAQTVLPMWSTGFDPLPPVVGS